jgi:hypothetical protein
MEALNGGLLAVFEETLESEWGLIKAALVDESIVLPEVIRQLADVQQLPRFKDIILNSLPGPECTEQGGPMGLLAYLRSALRPTPHFLIDDNLLEVLEHTEIQEDIPVAMFKVPYKRFYIELGQKRQGNLTIPNAASGDHFLEGAYVEKGHHKDGERLYFVLTGSPLGKVNAADDATLSFSISLADGSRSMASLFLASYREARKESIALGLNVSPESWNKDILKAVELIVKALLYIGLADVRREFYTPKTAGLKAIKLVKSVAKRVKAQRGLNRLYDFILISPLPSHVKASQQFGTASSETRATHWRRGHYRLQPHGELRSLRKVIFLEPMLIGFGSTGGASAAHYKVV